MRVGGSGQGRGGTKQGVSSGWVPWGGGGGVHCLTPGGIWSESHLRAVPSKAREPGFQILTSFCHRLQPALGGCKFPGTSGLKEPEQNRLHKPIGGSPWERALGAGFAKWRHTREHTTMGKDPGDPSRVLMSAACLLIHTWITFQQIRAPETHTPTHTHPNFWGKRPLPSNQETFRC